MYVALTFRWLLALGLRLLRLLRLLLLQLPAPLSLQHRVFILGLPVDVTLGWREQRRSEGRINRKIGGWNRKKRDREVNIGRKGECSVEER